MYQLRVGDSHNLSGKSVEKILSIINEIISIKNIGVLDMEGTFDSKAYPDGDSYGLKTFLTKVHEVDQFDWGFIFININPDILISERSKQACFMNSDIVIRLTDSSIYYFYTNISELKELMAKKLDFDEIIFKGEFKNLDILY